MAEDNTGRMPKHGEVCWTEIATTNLDQAHEFYSSVFGWSIRKGDDPDFEYRHFDDGKGEDVGGIYEMNSEMFGGEVPPPHFISYLAVDDIDAAVDAIRENGGEIHREATEIPNTGKMAVVADPLGAVFAIIQLYGDR